MATYRHPQLRRRTGDHRRSHRLLATVIATLLGTLTAGLLVVRKHLAFPETPRVLTLENARPDEWVRLEGATLDCASRLEVGSNLYARTYFAGHSSGGRDFVAAYDKGVTCVVARSQLEGVVSDLNPHLRETLTKNGLPLALGPVAKLCTECGPRQTRLGIVILLVGAALGAFLVWAGVAEYRGRVSGR